MSPTPRLVPTWHRLIGSRARLLMLTLVTWLTLIGLCQSAVAEDKSADEGLSHANQFGLRVGMAIPFKVNFRFDDSPQCGATTTGEDKKVCPIAAPLALDLALSYGIGGALEPFIWWRIGLAAERDTNTQAISVIGAGLRLYTSSVSQFKVFLQPAIGAELEGPLIATPGRNYDTDVLAQVQVGGQYDIMRHVGAFFSLGPSVSFVRALSLGVEANFGVQGRLP